MQISNVEQGSYEWHVLRQGKVTGTTLKSALGTPKVQQTLRYKLIAERMTEPQIDDINTPAIAHGKELEPLARKAASELLGLEFDEVGMLIDGDFGLSPDGVFFESGEVVGGIEIKCPNSKKHIEYLMLDEIPSEYLHQVKAPFLISDKIQWWVFVSFDDRNYERPIMVKTLNRADYLELEADRNALDEFLKSVSDQHESLTF